MSSKYKNGLSEIMFSRHKGIDHPINLSSTVFGSSLIS